MGWKFTGADADVQEEYPVEGMAGVVGQRGYCDYVLFGKDGLPLAVVEAKRTSKDPNIGRKQAALYADCLERKFGRRPMMFTTNGFETYFWDDQSSPRGKSAAFSAKTTCKADEPSYGAAGFNEHSHRRQNHRPVLPRKKPSGRSAGRSNRGFRKHLLVMATGTGKTRTASSLTDVLSRGKWVTNILFLADRTALVKAGKGRF